MSAASTSSTPLPSSARLRVFVCIASTFEKVVMIETEAKEAPESIVLECIRIAHETNMEVVKFINTIVETIGKPKFTFEKAAVNHDLLDDLCAYGMNQIEYALDTDDKNVREERLTAAAAISPTSSPKSMRTSTSTSRSACIRCRRRSSRSGCSPASVWTAAP